MVEAFRGWAFGAWFVRIHRGAVKVRPDFEHCFQINKMSFKQYCWPNSNWVKARYLEGILLLTEISRV